MKHLFSVLCGGTSILRFLLLLAVRCPLLLPSLCEQRENTTQDFHCTCLLNASVHVCKCVCTPWQVCKRFGFHKCDFVTRDLGYTTLCKSELLNI